MTKKPEKLKLSNIAKTINHTDMDALSFGTQNTPEHLEKLNELFSFLKTLTQGLKGEDLIVTKLRNQKSNNPETQTPMYTILHYMQQKDPSDHMINLYLDMVKDDDELKHVSNILKITQHLTINKDKPILFEKLKQYYPKHSEHINKTIIETIHDGYKENGPYDLNLFKRLIIGFYIDANIEKRITEKKDLLDEKELGKLKTEIFFDLIKDFKKPFNKISNQHFLSNHINKDNYSTFISNIPSDHKTHVFNCIQLKVPLFETCPEFKAEFSKLLEKNEITAQNLYDSIRDDKDRKKDINLASYLIDNFGERKEVFNMILNSVFISRNQDKNKAYLLKFFQKVISEYENDIKSLDSKQIFLIMKRCSHSGLVNTIKETYDLVYRKDRQAFEEINNYLTLSTISIPCYKKTIEFNADEMFSRQMRTAMREVLEKNLAEKPMIKKMKI